jgi:molybdopterin molybdotransferase
MSSAPSVILPFAEARRTVEKHAAATAPGATELLDLLDAGGRVLAEDIVADRDFPPFPRATRDGYAVRAEDTAALPVSLRMVGEIRAGASAAASAIELHSGEAFRIMTGAPVPSGSDAVVMVEYTDERDGRVVIQRSATPGENFVPTGSEARRGNVLLDRGTLLTESAVAVAASVGKARLQVRTRPSVAVLSTGDEIVDVRVEPRTNQIRNSNTYSLATQIKAAGAVPVLLPVAPDEPVRLRQLIEEGLRSDLLLLAGGVSMGKYDLVEQVLIDLAAEFYFTGALIQPGKPIVFGRVHGKYFFGLPGNPVSTMVTFELFARPMIDALGGRQAQPLSFTHVRLKSEIRVKTGLTRFLPAVLTGEFEHTEVELVKWQGSGDIAATARANCYAVVPPDRDKIAAGKWIAIIRK